MRGFSLLELLLAIAIAATLVGIAVPVTTAALDEIRTASAARHLASRIAAARIDAVRRATAVGLRFEPDGDDYLVSAHADGNGNGVRSAEIRTGVDLLLERAEPLRHQNPGVRFGLLAGVPDLDGAIGSTDGVRVGTARIVALSPDGGATSGTLYVRGQRAQYAVRVLGATGRVRVFHYDPGARRWNSR
jgi:prepilin-type N-terminal cleavage/methylation domain-containing protein